MTDPSSSKASESQGSGGSQSESALRSASSAGSSRAASSSTPRRVCVFRLGNSTYGVDVKAVRRIVTIEGLVPVPRSPSSLIGLQIIRGVAIPVVSLAEVLSLAEPLDQVRQAHMALVLVLDGVECGAAIERIEGVFDVRKAELQPRSSDAEPAAIAGIYPAVGDPPQPVTLLSIREISHRIHELRIRKH